MKVYPNNDPHRAMQKRTKFEWRDVCGDRLSHNQHVSTMAALTPEADILRGGLDIR